jgi:hypothetical protein
MMDNDVTKYQRELKSEYNLETAKQLFPEKYFEPDKPLSKPYYKCDCVDKEFRYYDDPELTKTREGNIVCTNCGVVCAIEYSSVLPYQNNSRFSKPLIRNNRFSSGNMLDEGSDGDDNYTSYNLYEPVSFSRGRYKREFHWNERYSQMVIDDPVIPQTIIEAIEDEILGGNYGPTENLGRSDIFIAIRKLQKKYPNGIVDEYWKDDIKRKANFWTPDKIREYEEYADKTILMSDKAIKRKHDKIIDKLYDDQNGRWETDPESSEVIKTLKFITFKERWKRILLHFTEKPILRLSQEEFEWASRIHRKCIGYFNLYSTLMPLSLIRKRGAKNVIRKIRHNFLPFNYIFCKIQEARGNWNYHWELPFVRSHIKLQILDKITEKIFGELGLPFTRSVIIKRPKYKKKC